MNTRNQRFNHKQPLALELTVGKEIYLATMWFGGGGFNYNGHNYASCELTDQSYLHRAEFHKVFVGRNHQLVLMPSAVTQPQCVWSVLEYHQDHASIGLPRNWFWTRGPHLPISVYLNGYMEFLKQNQRFDLIEQISEAFTNQFPDMNLLDGVPRKIGSTPASNLTGEKVVKSLAAMMNGGVDDPKEVETERPEFDRVFGLAEDSQTERNTGDSGLILGGLDCYGERLKGERTIEVMTVEGLVIFRTEGADIVEISSDCRGEKRTVMSDKGFSNRMLKIAKAIRQEETERIDKLVKRLNPKA